MKLRKAISIVLALLGLNSHGQNKNNASLYAYFGQAIGLRNPSLNNGTAHLNPFKSFDQSYR